MSPQLQREQPVAVQSRLRRVLESLGLARATVVSGVQYRPRRRRRQGVSQREYDVQFPSGERMRIRPGPTRRYPDLTGEGLARDVLQLEHRVRPGERLLVLHSGCGLEAAYLARLVGPSGSIVALDRDGELVRYARRRYPASNIAYEVGGLKGLEGELDGAFDGVLVLERQPTAGGEASREEQAIQRILREGGWLMVPLAAGPDGKKRFAVRSRPAPGV